MNRFTIMENPEFWKWIEMEDLTEPEGIREKLGKKYLSEKFEELKATPEGKRHPEFRKMKIESVEIFDKGIYSEEGLGDTGNLPAFAKIVVRHAMEGKRFASIRIFLPFVWNGRLLACTGGGAMLDSVFSNGEGLAIYNQFSVARALRNHFASVLTNGGIIPTGLYTAAWGFKEGTDTLDWEMFLNWAYYAVHNMTTAAKAFCQIVYGEKPAYSYITGSSAGGRQAAIQPQAFPEDYDGAWVGCPATPWVPHHISEGWPYFVLNNENHRLPHAKLEAMRTAILEKYGRVEEQYVNSTHTIEFDFYSLVGKETAAGPFTEEDARVLTKIYDGPHFTDGRKMRDCDRLDPLVRIWRADLWMGQIPINEDGSFDEEILPARLGVIQQVLGWVTGNPDLDLSTLTYEDIDEIYRIGDGAFKFLSGTSIDMRDFRDRGGKMIYTMATGDGMSPHSLSLRYCEDLTRFFGQENLDSFFRFYYTYGGQHTSLNSMIYGDQLAIGPSFAALMKWVENGEAPEVLPTVCWDHSKDELGWGEDSAPYRAG